MSLDQRVLAILKQLINANSYLSINELTERLNVSRRTIYYDLDKLNHWLEGQGLAKVEQVRSAGFILPEETKKLIPIKIEDIQAYHYEYSFIERKAWLAIYLLVSDNTLHLENLMQIARVSRNTTIEDIKALKKELKRFNLELEYVRKLGYEVFGKEIEIRQAVVYYLSQIVPEQSFQSIKSNIQMHLNAYGHANNLFNINALESIYSVIAESEQDLNIQFTDDVLHSLSLRWVLFTKRIKQGKFVQMDDVEKEVLSRTKAYTQAIKISQKLEDIFQIAIPENEQFYMTTHLLSAKVNYYEEDFFDHTTPVDLPEIAKNMVDDFQINAFVIFQNRDLLEKNLLLHLKPAYYRLKYGLDVDNQLVESVKTKYPEVFSLTKKVVSHLERVVGKPIPDNEVAFISIHFGGWMKRDDTTPITRKKALLVCANGVGTSQFLKQQLEGLLSSIDITETVSIREYEQKSFDVDFVISTTPVSKDKHPVFIVNPILTEAEKKGLLNKINSLFDNPKQHTYSIEGLVELIERHAEIHDKETLIQELKQYINRPDYLVNEQYKPNLTELITTDTIQFAISANNWMDAIAIAAKPLLQNGSITSQYIEEMINNIQKMGPYIVIAPRIAIPHANPDQGVQKLGMSLLRLENQVAFSEDSKHNVNILVVLAAIDNERHLKALSQFTKLLSMKDSINQLMKAKTEEELFTFIEQTILKES